MAANHRAEIIKAHIIGHGLDAWSTSFDSIYIENILLDLLFALRNVSTSRLLPSNTSHGTLQHDLQKLISAVASETFDLAHILPLLNAVVARKPDSDT
ncbi:uncharacterized protein N7483_002455 [Penicillium malachiteum]|uniref:uncharacterized protein n=1 Tax=Penicillium malachiteum TaxID=1324776 RepID=UPI002549916E|nr:uncharacterized protein N7483_002455 [Penicillium malachiteum]KAJ5737330.1 hypothetical protein N7483_002455 [Penicillium malachiteum]